MKRRTMNAECRTKTARPGPRSSFCVHRSSFCVSAFTLTEIMVVIVIVVLMLSMAMPVFRAMNGSRSQESASNQIAAMLGAARSQAIGLQQNIGVAFFPDSTGRYQMAIVERKMDGGFATMNGRNTLQPYSKWTYIQHQTIGGGPFVAVQDAPAGTSIINTAFFRHCDMNVIDKTDDSDTEALPMGVGVQLLNDWGLASPSGASTPKSDAYVSTGVIMFDSQGRLSSKPISIIQGGVIGSTMNMASTGSNNYPEWQSNSMTPGIPVNGALYSSFGLVLFDKDAFQSQGFDTIDPTYSPHISPKSGSYTTGSPSEQTEESWLDQNATPLLINRFNGTLVKGE
jgi:Tfp pilus assembly protein FimT